MPSDSPNDSPSASFAPQKEIVHESRHIRVKACRYGTMLYNAGDSYVGQSLDIYGEFSEGEVRIFDQVLKPGMIAIDAGANIGCHTVFMAAKVSPKGTVIAFEAQRVIHQMLCANLALNAIENVIAFHAAVGEAEGEIIVPGIDYEKGGNYGGIALGSYKQGERVPVKTIDSIGLGACHFIKIDVEGMENETIAGAADTIKKFDPILYVENDRRDRAQELIERLLGLGYRLYWHLPQLFNPDNYFANKENVFENLISRNMFCIPKNNPLTITNFQEITSPDEEF